MERREFIRRMGLALAAGWAFGKLAWPVNGLAGAPRLRLALLADAHLKDGNGRRPEALALARAVAEIKALTPSPDLVLFAGDLSHKGRPDALDLGKEILADLPAPVWVVRGEGDHGPGGKSAWVRRFGEPWFSRAYGGFHLVGLDTALCPTSRGPVFEIGADQRQWLARELSSLSPSTPLVIISHAPLARLFRPWQQWTGDAPEVARLLEQFSQVQCLHGHVHGAGGRVQGETCCGQRSEVGFGATGPDTIGSTENRKLKTENYISLPATAWPRPLAVQGTPALLHPGAGPRGCGWTLLTLGPQSITHSPRIWQA